MNMDDPREPVEGAPVDDLPLEPGEDDLPEQDNPDEGADTTSDQQPTDDAPRSRADRREDTLRIAANEAREAREAAERARRDLEDYQRRVQAPDPRIEQERIQNMDPEARLRYEADQRFNQLRQEQLSSHFRSEARLDKLDFRAALAAQPAYRKYEDEVEQRYQAQFDAAWRQGNPNLIVSRDVFLTQVVGADVRKNGEKALKTARETGQRNIQRQTTKTGSVSGNVRPGRSADNAAEAAMKRMRAAGVLED